jgi:putative oxidoreductase
MSTETMHATHHRERTSSWRAIFATEDRLGPAIARLTLAVIFFAHGSQKLLGWFGGGGFEATMNNFTQAQGLPWIVAFLLIITEFFGSLFLLVGFATRIWALGIGAIMIGAIVMVHWPYGFFMDWGGTMAGEGFEFHLLALGLVGVLLAAGGGMGSIDHRIAHSEET